MPGQSQGSGDSEVGSQNGGGSGGGSESDRKRRRHRSPSSDDDELSVEYYTDSSSPDIIPFRQPTPKRKRIRKPKRNRLSRSRTPGNIGDEESVAVEDEGDPKPTSAQSYVREPTALLTIRSKAKEKAIEKAIEKASKSGNNATPKSAATQPLRGKGIPKFNEPYLDLLNNDIEDARSPHVYSFEGFLSMSASMIQATLWSPEEKEAFFGALPRVGRDNFEALSKAVGSKSTVECAAYEMELRKASEDMHARAKDESRIRESLITLAQIPAAFEVSDECVAALEEEAEKLESYRVGEELKDIKRENKWMGYDVLNNDNASKIPTTTENEAEEDVVPSAAKLLNLEVFLKLSEKFYMTEPASIRHQAFVDFYTLAVSLIRRLLHVSLFQAYARMKMRSITSEEEAEVKISDVAAAVDILGITPTSEEFWRGFARRNNLEVRRRPRLLDENGRTTNVRVRQILSYRQVEKALQTYEKVRFEPPTETMNTSDDDYIDEDDEDEETENKSYEPDAIYDWKKYLKGCSLEDDIEEHRIIRETLRQAKEEDDYLEYIDKISSLKHEVDLWKVLGATLEHIDKMKDDILGINEVPPPPVYLKYRVMDQMDQMDWRDGMFDKRLWEEDFYGKLWKQERYGEVQRIQPNVNGEISDSGSESDYMDDTQLSADEENNGQSANEIVAPRSQNEVEPEDGDGSPRDNENEVEGEDDVSPSIQQEAERENHNDDRDDDPLPIQNDVEPEEAKPEGEESAPPPPPPPAPPSPPPEPRGVQLELMLPTRRSKRLETRRSMPSGFVSTVNNVEASVEEPVPDDDSDAASIDSMAWWE